MTSATDRNAQLDSAFYSWFSGATCAVLLLIALKPITVLWGAAAGDGWLRLEIVGPWLFTVLIGFELLVSLKRGLLKPRVASSVMTILGVVVTFVYNAMFHLKFGH